MMQNGGLFRFKKMFILVLAIIVSSFNASAAILDDLTDANGRYVGPSVEDNVLKMDTDHNGFADVYEVRAYLELKHGKGYKKALLDELESSASGKSCGTPFAQQLYSN